VPHSGDTADTATGATLGRVLLLIISAAAPVNRAKTPKAANHGSLSPPSSTTSETNPLAGCVLLLAPEVGTTPGRDVPTGESPTNGWCGKFVSRWSRLPGTRVGGCGYRAFKMR
jgi:hypothetical protein